jgi:hypothetical protein
MNGSRKSAPLTDEDEARIQQQIAADPDAPEASDEELAQAQTFAEAFPRFADAVRRARGRPPVEAPGNRSRFVSIRM